MYRLAIDTGTPRNVTGHLVSGALASGTIATAINYNRYKNAEIDKNAAIKNSLKLAVQGGIATSSAIAAANYLGKGETYKMLSAISLGILGVYTLEKLDEKLNNKQNETILITNNGEK